LLLCLTVIIKPLI